MFERFLWVFWALWVFLVLVATLKVVRFRLGLIREKFLWGKGTKNQRPVAVIVPIKGISPHHTPAFFQSLLEQSYSRYRVIVAVETINDPAAEWLLDQFDISLTHPVWLAPESESGITELRLVVAGEARDQGQKVQNQLAAFEHLTPEDEIIAFVDADILCPEDWLARLTAPINQKTHNPATTYRWLVPAKMRLASQFASVMNASVTTQGGSVRENMPWGGSMAITQGAFNKLNVPQLFTGSLNDDLRLGKAAKKAGYSVGYIRNLVRPTEVDFTWGSLFEFARRQYFQVKIFAPILYTCANFIFLFYILGFFSALYLVITGYLFAWVPLILVALLDQWRAVTRESIYRNLFGHDKRTYKKIAATGWVEHFLTPVWMTLHGLIIFSTWFMSKVTWGGIKYQVKGVNKTRVLSRSPSDDLAHLVAENLSVPDGGMVVAIEGAALHTGTPGIEESQTYTADPTEEFAVEAGTGLKAVDPTEPINVAALKAEAEAEAEEPPPTVDPTEPVTVRADPVEELAVATAIPVGACEYVLPGLLPELEIETEEEDQSDSAETRTVRTEPSEPVAAYSGARSAIQPLGAAALNGQAILKNHTLPRIRILPGTRTGRRKSNAPVKILTNRRAYSHNRIRNLSKPEIRRLLRRRR